MKNSNKKRFFIVGGAITTVAAGAALIAGATFGFFSSAGTAGGLNEFTAGTVLVGNGTGTQLTCDVGPMSPGDTQATGVGADVCEYDIKYTGNVNAWLAVDIVITGNGGTPVAEYTQTTAPAAAQGLYDGTSLGLQLTIADQNATYVTGTNYYTQVITPTTAPLAPTAGEASISNLLMNTVAVNTNDSRHLTINYSLPSGAGNEYNGAVSTIQLTVHAVQADNNPLPADCSVGHLCSATMTWN